MDRARNRPAKAGIGFRDIDQGERHAGELEIEIEIPAAEIAGHDHPAIAIGELRWCEAPAPAVQTCEHGAARHGNAATGKPTPCGERNAIGPDGRIRIQHEAPAAPARERGIHPPDAVLDLAAGCKLGNEQRPVRQSGCRTRAGKARIAIANETRRIDIRAGDAQGRIAAEARIAGSQVDLKALSAAARRQRHGSVETATGESERAVRAAIYQHDGAGDTGVGHAHGLDRDAGRTAGRCDKAKLAGKGSEHRIAFGIDGKSLF